MLTLLAACSQEAEERQPEPQSAVLLQPSVRRLSLSELERGAEDVLGMELDWSSQLPPDARQHDFSRSLTQSVDAVTLTQLYDAVASAANVLELSSSAFPTCAASASDGACADEVVAQLATRAFRRSPAVAELAKLRALFDTATTSGSFRDGVVLVARALLGSPQFLYDTALGAANNGNAAENRLSDAELASQLAWLVSGAPPDAELLAAAGTLRSGAERLKQAQRLLGKSESRYLYRRFVEEWLGLEKLGDLAKSSSVVTDFPTLRGAMLQETDAVVDDVLINANGSIEALFAGSFSLVPPGLAPFYGIETPKAAQRVSLARLGRVGLLQHASFLATFAHEDESAPVLRGKAVLERLLCRPSVKPSELGINVVLPAPDPGATTRERFAVHASQPACSGCHEALDGIGFTFENFDAVGRWRDAESGKPIVSTGHAVIDGEELDFADSAELSRALAKSEELSECAARHVVRFAAGEASEAVENDFVARTRRLPAEDRGALTGLLLAYVQGDWFAKRTTR